MSAAELRAELRELRKTHPDFKPVSKMHKSDVSSLLQRLKVHTEETPAAGQMKDASKKVKPSVESIKKAKEVEFPMEPADEGSTKKGMARKTARKAYEEPSKAEVKEMKKEVKKAEKKVEKKADKKDEKKKDEKKSDSKKPAKGSKEMAEKMARLRALRKSKSKE